MSSSPTEKSWSMSSINSFPDLSSLRSSKKKPSSRHAARRLLAAASSPELSLASEMVLMDAVGMPSGKAGKAWKTFAEAIFEDRLRSLEVDSK